MEPSIESIEAWKDLLNKSDQSPIIVFKHSTRCSISSMAQRRLYSSWDQEWMDKCPIHYLDLIEYRDVSNQIAEDLALMHESPQVIVIQNQKVLYHTSHNGINGEALKELISPILS